MKPAPFAYYAPSAVSEVLELLATVPESKVLAGGQSLMPLLNMRLARPSALIDINTIPDLATIRLDNDRLTIGATVRHAELLGWAAAHNWPLLQETEKLIGHVAIRNRGTVVGSVVHGDPAAELPTVLTLLDGVVVAASTQGIRRIPIQQFYLGYLTNALLPEELVVAVELPAPCPIGVSFVEFSRRRGDFALIGAAAWIECGAGSCVQARLVLAGVDGKPWRATDVETLLSGAQMETHQAVAEWFAQAGALVYGAVNPEGDLHASTKFRKHLADIFTQRALWTAFQRTKWGRHLQGRSGHE